MAKIGYIKVKNGNLLSSVHGMPNWLRENEDGETVPVTDDETFIEHGEFPVYKEEPEYDFATQRVHVDPQENWLVLSDRVEVTHTVEDKSAKEIQEYWLEQIRIKREKALKNNVLVKDSKGDAHAIPISDRTLALVPAMAAKAKSKRQKRPVPTVHGVLEFTAKDLETIDDALDKYVTAVMRREAQLEGILSRGNISQNAIETGWPDRDILRSESSE